MKQKPEFSREKRNLFRNKLSAGPVNSFRPNFETETNVPSRDTQRKLSEFDGVDLQPIICNTDGVKIGLLPAIGNQKPRRIRWFSVFRTEILLQKCLKPLQIVLARKHPIDQGAKRSD
jgi:hypothetical protein